MQINGKQTTQQQELNLYKKQLIELKKQVLTESINNDIIFVSKMIRMIEIPMKYAELENKRLNVRTQKEFNQIEKQLNKIDNNFYKEFNVTIFGYLKSINK
jgi:hypothetical protein